MKTIIHVAVERNQKDELEKSAKTLTEKYKVKVSISNVVRMAIDQYLENEKLMREFKRDESNI